MSNCRECGSPLSEHILPKHSIDLGGVTVELKNAVHVRACDGCKEVETMIPDLRGLTKAVAMARALLPFRLQPEDIRFMRRALDMTQAEFAKAMNVAVETVSRWENGVKGHGGDADKSVRHNVCALLHPHAPGISYDPADITRMEYADPGVPLPKIVVERIVLKTGATRTDTWDTVPMAA